MMRFKVYTCRVPNDTCSITAHCSYRKMSDDTIYLDSLDRLGRNYFDIVDVWKELTRDKGVELKCLDLDFFDSAKFKEIGSIGICVEDVREGRLKDVTKGM